jgi:hypothetical protein
MEEFKLPQIGRYDARYEMDFTDPLQVLMKSRELPLEELGTKNRLREILNSDSKDVSSGCKERDELTFLLMLLATRSSEEFGIVEGNVNRDEWSHRSKYCRITNPKTAQQCKSKFWSRSAGRAIPDLLASGWRASTCVVSNGYIDVSEGDWTENCYRFWGATVKGLKRITRNGKIKVLYSHELSVASLGDDIYYPHTHVIYFYRGEDPIERFNQVFTTEDVMGGGRVRNIKNLVRYLYAVYTPIKAYSREVGVVPLKKLNQKAWDWVENARWVFNGVKRVGELGFRSGAVKNVSLPSVGEGNKILEDNYIYEKPRRLFNRCGRRAGRERESTAQTVCGEGMAPESRNGEMEHAPVYRGSPEGESGISSWTEGGYAPGGSRRSCYRGIFQGVRRDSLTVHGGSGESGKPTGSTSWRRVDEHTQHGDAWIEAAYTGRGG